MRAPVVERHLSPGRRLLALSAMLALGFVAQVFSFQIDKWGLTGTAWQGFAYRLGRSLMLAAPIAFLLLPLAAIGRTLPNVHSKRWMFMALIAILSLGGLEAFRGSSVLVDGQRYWSLREDQMISLRSAVNLVQGHGLTFNAPEAAPAALPARVQGFSNPFWTLSMAGLASLGLPARLLPAAVILLDLLICVGLLLNLMAMARGFGLGHERRVDPGFHIRPAPMAFAILCLAFITGSDLAYLGVLGVESPLLLLLMLRIWRNSKEGRLLWPYALALSLVRADGWIYALMLGLAVAYARQKPRFAASVILPALLGAGLWMLFAKHYYGAWLPATVHLKATLWPGRWKAGLDFVSTHVAKHAFFFGLSTLGFASAVWAGPDARIKYYLPTRPAVLALGFLCAGNLAYVAYTGGDYAACSRFLMPNSAISLLFACYALTLPWNRLWFALFSLCFLLLIPSDWGAVISMNDPIWWGHTRNAAAFAPLVFAAMAMGLLMPAGAHIPGRALGLGILLILSLPLYPLMQGRVVQINEPLVRQALFLKENVKQGQAWAGVEVGILGYYSERPVVDLLGHTDLKIAMRPANLSMLPGHNKYDYDYSLGQLKPCWLAEYAPEVQDVFIARDNYIAAHGDPRFRLHFRRDLLAHPYAQDCFKDLVFQNQDRAVYRCKQCTQAD